MKMYFSGRIIRNGKILFSLVQNNSSKLQSSIVIHREMGSYVKPLKGMFKLSLVGVTVGALVGTGYSLKQLNKPRGHIPNEKLEIPILSEEEVPKITPTRRVQINGDLSGLKLILYQYQTCPFCCKVRSFLDYYGISYDVVEVDPVLRQSIKWSPYKKVPILLAKVKEGYQPLNDSSMIISSLATFLKDVDTPLEDIVKYYPSISYKNENGKSIMEVMNKYFLMLGDRNIDKRPIELINEERKWRKWADDVLVHTLSPNVYRTLDESFQAFNWFSEVGEWEKHFPAWERYLMIYVGAFAMWLIGKRLKKRHNLKDDVRQSLYDECNAWVKALRIKNTEFMGGSAPNLSDLAVYGVLSSIEGCDAFKDLLRHSKIKNWYMSMKNVVKNHGGSAFI